MTEVAPRTLSIERVLPHSPEKIWRALTETDLLAQWLLPNDFQPTPGHAFTFRTDPAGDWDGVIGSEVLDARPHERLSYRWNVLDSAGNGMHTVVTWTLTPVQDGVLLRLEHSGFRADQGNQAQGAEYGWQMFLGGLEKTLAALD